MASVIEKMGSTIYVEDLLKEGKINPLTIYLLNEENLCETFHCLPKDLEDMDPFTMDVLVAILRGKNTGRQSIK